MRERRQKNRGKEIIIVTLVCLICLSAVAVGNYFLGKKDKSEESTEKQIINLNAETTEDKTTNGQNNDVAVDGNVVKEDETSSKKATVIIEDETTAKKDTIDKETYDGNISNQAQTIEEEETTTQQEEAVNANSAVSNLNFGEDDKIEWPVKGNVLLDYSMANTIYFPTLDTYKCNPAIIIQSEKGTEVKAGVRGVVKEVTTEDEIGNCIVVEIGNGYELTYGQLSDIKVSEGDTVESDTCIGLVADTTRYYKNEGTNLYFKMTKDGEPCDPMDYLN